MPVQMKPLEWFEQNAKAQLEHAKRQQECGLAQLKRGIADELEARQLLNEVAAAARKGKKEMKVK